MIEEIFNCLTRYRFSLSDEKRTQEQIETVLKSAAIPYLREHRLSDGDIVDFMCGDIAVEIKVQGSRMKIFRQIERYAANDSVSGLILVTNVATGFPREVNGKPVYVLNLAMAWL